MDYPEFEIDCVRTMPKLHGWTLKKCTKQVKIVEFVV